MTVTPIRDIRLPRLARPRDNAPHAGRWFHDQLVMLVQNAFPAL